MDLQRLFTGDAEAVASLAAGELSTWQPLLEHLHANHPATAPKGFVDAVLATKLPFASWVKLAHNAASHVLTSAERGSRPFWPWLISGFAGALPEDHPFILEVRGWAVQQGLDTRTGQPQPEEEWLAAAEQLVTDARRVLGESPQLAELLLLVHRRATEANRQARALDAAIEAERLFEVAGVQNRVDVARRQQGASLLRLGRVGEALALLDPVLEETGPYFIGTGMFSSIAGERTQAEEALDELATIATWAHVTTPEWVLALGGIAERPLEPGQAAELWSRFEGALTAMLESSDGPDEDLEVVVRQAGQRELTATVERALRVGAALGIEPAATPAWLR